MYRVRWTRRAINQLASIWMGATDRNAITQASHRIDVALASDPIAASESRPNGERVMYESPLGARFRVHSKTRTVRVHLCWQIRQV